MVLSKLNELLIHVRRGNLDLLRNILVDNTLERVPNYMEFIEEEKVPPWLESSDVQNIYKISDSDYTSTTPTSDMSINTETDDNLDLKSIELPIVYPSECEKITIRSSDESSDRKKEAIINTDNLYDYPPVLWIEFPRSPKGNKIQIQSEIEDRDLSYKLLGTLSKKIKSSTSPAKTKIGTPAIVPETHKPPIFLISIDSLRYDHKKQMVPLIQELGSNAIIPSEPRTQGAWTPPSHASMLTGTHPGKHGFVELARTLGRDGKRPIDPKLTTISKLLTDNGYKCSGTVSHSQILPKFGFGRGFHRFNYDGMSYSDWISREHDVKSSVNKLINWIDQDTAIRDHSLFYFLHVFDPHYPYIPPTEFLKSSTIDFSKPKKFTEEFQQFGNSQWTYVDGYENNIDTNKQIIKDIQSWYSKSVKYTANKISHLINHIKKAGIFEDSLIIITGDHGEEFGQRGFVTHRTVYDNNIRPFMTIKPPASKSWSGIEEIDTIDFLPTIARIIGSKIPDQCDGTPIQDGRKKSHRITENIYPDWYNISVEIDGIKKIFTYRSNYPDRPTKKTIQSGPHLTEYYELSSVRRGNTQEHDPGRQTKTNLLLNIAEDFILNNDSYSGDATTSGPTQETLNQLESLGYQ